MPFSHSQNALVRKLQSIVQLSEAERAAIAGLAFQLREYKRGSDIARLGDRPSHCCVVLEGFACRYKILEPGARQIFSFHISGDIPDLHSIHIERMDHALGAVTPLRAGLLPHELIRAFLREHPRISDALWRETLIDAAIFREWMAGLGARDSYARMAHFFCEMVVRMRAVGLVAPAALTVPLPMTQIDMSDALGMTPVHVNRTLKALREAQIASHDHGELKVYDWDALAKAGGFYPDYLHLVRSKPR